MTHTAVQHTHDADPPAVNPQTFNSPWQNAALVERLKILWKDHSATETAQALNREFSAHLTRSQVMGKVSRLGLTSEHKTEVSARAVRKKRSSVPVHHRPKLHIVANGGGGMRVMTSVETEMPSLRSIDLAPLNLTIATLEPGSCRYVVCDREWLFCGHPKRPASPYCASHHAICYRPLEVRR